MSSILNSGCNTTKRGIGQGVWVVSEVTVQCICWFSTIGPLYCFRLLYTWCVLYITNHVFKSLQKLQSNQVSAISACIGMASRNLSLRVQSAVYMRCRQQGFLWVMIFKKALCPRQRKIYRLLRLHSIRYPIPYGVHYFSPGPIGLHKEWSTIWDATTDLCENHYLQ